MTLSAGLTAAIPAKTNEKRRSSPQPNRFFLSFGTKYAKVHDQIVRDAEADDREPGEFLVRWLQQNYKSGADKE